MCSIAFTSNQKVAKPCLTLLEEAKHNNSCSETKQHRDMTGRRTTYHETNAVEILSWTRLAKLALAGVAAIGSRMESSVGRKLLATEDCDEKGDPDALPERRPLLRDHSTIMSFESLVERAQTDYELTKASKLCYKPLYDALSAEIKNNFEHKRQALELPELNTQDLHTVASYIAQMEIRMKNSPAEGKYYTIDKVIEDFLNENSMRNDDDEKKENAILSYYTGQAYLIVNPVFYKAELPQLTCKDTAATAWQPKDSNDYFEELMLSEQKAKISGAIGAVNYMQKALNRCDKFNSSTTKLYRGVDMTPLELYKWTTGKSTSKNGVTVSSDADLKGKLMFQACHASTSKELDMVIGEKIVNGCRKPGFAGKCVIEITCPWEELGYDLASFPGEHNTEEAEVILPPGSVWRIDDVVRGSKHEDPRLREKNIPLVKVTVVYEGITLKEDRSKVLEAVAIPSTSIPVSNTLEDFFSNWNDEEDEDSAPSTSQPSRESVVSDKASTPEDRLYYGHVRPPPSRQQKRASRRDERRRSSRTSRTSKRNSFSLRRQSDEWSQSKRSLDISFTPRGSLSQENTWRTAKNRSLILSHDRPTLLEEESLPLELDQGPQMTNQQTLMKDLLMLDGTWDINEVGALPDSPENGEGSKDCDIIDQTHSTPEEGKDSFDITTGEIPFTADSAIPSLDEDDEPLKPLAGKENKNPENVPASPVSFGSWGSLNQIGNTSFESAPDLPELPKGDDSFDIKRAIDIKSGPERFPSLDNLDDSGATLNSLEVWKENTHSFRGNAVGDVLTPVSAGSIFDGWSQIGSASPQSNYSQEQNINFGRRRLVTMEHLLDLCEASKKQ